MRYSKRKVLLSLGATASILSCVDSELATAPRRLRSLFSYSVDSTPSALSVTLSNPSAPGYFLESAGYYDFTATVSGGSGGYAYKWFSRWCDVRDGPCAANYIARAETGQTLTYRVQTYDWRNFIVVQVKDTVTGDVGADTVVVDGPKDVPEPTPGGSGVKCNLGHWPFHYLDSIRRDTSYMTAARRNACTWFREESTYTQP
jgi:hypothetical protein